MSIKKPTRDQVEAMEFPVRAIGKVTVGRAEYASKEVFDAGSIENVNALKSRKAAEPVTSDEFEPEAGAASSTSVAQTDVDAAQRTGVAAQDAPLSSSGAKGTSNDTREPSVGARPVGSSIRR